LDRTSPEVDKMILFPTC